MRRIFKGLLIGIATGIIGSLLTMSPYGAIFERNVGLGILFNIRGALPPPTEVAIVAIDNRTGEQLDLPSLPREWPRSIHATLIDNLVERGASVIVFDIHFHKPKSQHHDQLLVDSVTRANRVVLVEQVNGKRQPVLNAEGKIVGAVWAEELLQPFPQLARAAKGLGTFTLPKTEAAASGFWVFKESVGHAPTIPAVAMHLYSMPPATAIADEIGNNSLLNTPGVINDESEAEILTGIMQKFRMGYSGQRAANDEERPEYGVSDNPMLQRMYQGSGYRYINFYGPPGTIATIPYHAVIKGSDPNVADDALDFSGKVVFVGYSDLYDPGQPDRFYTVFTQADGIDLSGVEIAATAFANLLHDQSLKLPPGFQSAVLVFFLGVLLGTTAYLLPAVFAIPLAITLTALYAYYVQSVFNTEEQWLPLATPVIVQLPIALLLGLIGQYFFERHRSQRISQALNYYLPESAAKQLSQNKIDPDALNNVVQSTCFSTDMAGFSSIAENLEPGELALLLNDYFETLAGPLKNHGVNITEFRADAIMCAWAADHSSPDIRKQPLLAALAAVDAIDSYNQRHPSYQTKLRVGLETGPVYIGHAGGGGHFVYSIVGDCANTASRIEGLNKHIGTQVLATDKVIDGINDLLVRYLGNFLFVNKSESTPIYEILSTQHHASVAQHILCKRFADALQCFHHGEWEKASHQLEAIIGEYPNDGPAKFFLNRSQQHQNGAMIPEDPRIIRMDSK